MAEEAISSTERQSGLPTMQFSVALCFFHCQSIKSAKHMPPWLVDLAGTFDKLEHSERVQLYRLLCMLGAEENIFLKPGLLREVSEFIESYFDAYIRQNGVFACGKKKEDTIKDAILE
ncbi:hypothetical protein NUW54_g6805 [Trametes sanguinea]|uniref:Uncharacterized protein n=1 Tax=Trametes sanguinea TaxID=158606 RepID=A0ACC1PU58_9APHY|nr:hypothetical protein NUW54_g6805 [Trametes sanguinea]